MTVLSFRSTKRTLNDNNIPHSQRASIRPSKLEQDTLGGTQSLGKSRGLSISATGSIRHHTVQHKSLSISPQKPNHGQDTPEWKKRLLHGEVPYGEQCDLFSPAGLENIFRPPPQNEPARQAPVRFNADDFEMPSSPPLYGSSNVSQSNPSSSADAGEGYQASASDESQMVKFDIGDRGSQQFPEGLLSRNSIFHPPFSVLERPSSTTQQKHSSDEMSGQARASLNSSFSMDAVRVFSGQSDVRHEGLSPIFISRHNIVDGRIDYSALDLPEAEPQQGLQHASVNDTPQTSQNFEGKLANAPWK